jgi:hypothetical protein
MEFRGSSKVLRHQFCTIINEILESSEKKSCEAYISLYCGRDCIEVTQNVSVPIKRKIKGKIKREMAIKHGKPKLRIEGFGTEHDESWWTGKVSIREYSLPLFNDDKPGDINITIFDKEYSVIAAMAGRWYENITNQSHRVVIKEDYIE